MTLAYIAADVDVRRLTPELAKRYVGRMWAVQTIDDLHAVGLELRKLYARDDAHLAANEVQLDQLRKVYASRLAIVRRSDPR